MFFYFGYGSNLSVISLRAKGVNPLRSVPAILEGWQLRFNVPDFFRIEGGTGNIQPCAEGLVHGVLHACRDAELAALDRLEALGYTYQREEVLVTGYDGQRKLAYTYVGIPSILDDSLLPSERYRNILVRGAVDMKLDSQYIERLRAVPTLVPPSYGPFAARGRMEKIFTPEDLASNSHLTALAGVVFDTTGARAEHAYLRKLLGGKDVTLLFLRRMDTSDGTETLDDVRLDRLSEGQRRFLNSYLHEFAREYRVAGQMDYDVSPPSGAFVAIGSPLSLRWGGHRRPSQAPARPSYAPRATRVASRAILDRADAMFHQLGHENMGFLSEANGFIPRERPRLELPREFAAWDQAAASLPDMYRSLRLRGELDRLPLLAADDDLPDEYLLRAASVLAILSHAYWYVETKPPAALPVALSRPWAEVRARLGRRQEVITYIDLIVYNWRLIDPERRDPMRIENMRLLTPTVDTAEERVFYLTQVEILAATRPIVGAVVRAQEAVVVDDRESLEAQLLTMLSCIEGAVRESLLNINPNPRSVTHVDPVIWAKTVAPFAVPMADGMQGPSGTSAPLFNLLDIFLGRKKFESFLGQEITQLRGSYPSLWRDFLGAVAEISIARHIQQIGDPNLSGLLHEIIATYAGPNGFLGRHRMKVYGYIELAFKVGRSVTIGGFKGVFRDRTWDRVDNELELSRMERVQSLPQTCHHVRVVKVTPEDPRSGVPVVDVVLNISGTGIYYEPGDRCGILPENDDELVERTLSALGARGDEEVLLTQEWIDAVQLRWRYRMGVARLPLAELLRFGSIRPVVPRAAEALYEITRSEVLQKFIQRGVLHRFELWDLLLELRRGGFDPTQLFAPDGDAPSSVLCRVIPPESFRMYSIASAMSSAETGADQHIRVSVSKLCYASETASGGPPIMRRGTASSFLSRAATQAEPVSLIVHRPARFSLPNHAKTPIVMIAGGTGLSPFRGFIAERLRQSTAGKAWLILGLRSRDHFVYGDELAPALRSGMLELSLAFSRDDVDLRFDPEASGAAAFVEVPGQRRRVTEVMLGDESARALWEMLTRVDLGACVYVCGRSGFARAAIDAIKSIFRRFAVGSEEEREATAQETLCKVVAEGRLMLEIFSGHTDDDPLPDIDMSELALHNDDRRGHWIAMDGKIYDLTEFIRLHPGGTRILQGYSGMVATEGYVRSHSHRSEIDAMREMYVRGRIRRLDLGDFSAVVQGPDGEKRVSLAAAHRVWVAALSLLVEMQDALRNDQALQDGITARGDPVRPRSPYKLQRAVETHERFLRNYLDLLVDECLPNLWTISQGVFAPEADPSWMRRAVAEVKTSYGARQSEATLEELYDAARHPTLPGEALEERATLVLTCDVLEEQDRRLLEDLKAILIAGLQIFEQLGRDAPSLGSELMLETCGALPERIQAYHDDVTARLFFMGWGSLAGTELGRANPLAG